MLFLLILLAIGGAFAYNLKPEIFFKPSFFLPFGKDGLRAWRRKGGIFNLREGKEFPKI
jgi:hypothetical protein